MRAGHGCCAAPWALRPLKREGPLQLASDQTAQRLPQYAFNLL